MSNYQKTIPVSELCAGMYVFQLDRSWNGTPFPLQGFHIKDESDVDLVAKYCKRVTIDITRSDIRKPSQKDKSDANKKPITRGKHHRTLELKPYTYPVTAQLDDEIKKARTIYKDLKHSIESLSATLQSNGSINLSTTTQISEKVVKSVLKNPDAMIWVMKLKHQTSDIYQHAMNCSVWAAVLGREIGLKECRLDQLVTGVLLSKIGLTLLSKEIAVIPFYEFQCMPAYYTHINLAINLLSTEKQLAKPVVDTIIHHEERYDGSGFPNELEGDQIPLYAQIAGIIDTYESMLNPYLTETPLSPSEAISEIYSMRGHEFDSKLIESFIQVLGLFPPGTLVELNNKELAIVTSAERDKRLQPKVLLVADANKKPKKRPATVDIYQLNADLKSKGKPSAIEISRCYPAGSFGIWPHEFNYQQDSILNRFFK